MVSRMEPASSKKLRSKSDKPIAMVGAMRPPLSIAAREQTASSVFDISGDDKLPTSRSPMLLRMFRGLRWTPSRQWPRRIVYVGVGDGHPSELREQALADTRAKGILIVRSARVGNGIVARNDEVNDDKRVSSFPTRLIHKTRSFF